MVHYKLYYFDVRGLGETIRLLLHYGNQPFNEERLTFDSWPQKKASMLYGKVPVLEVDGKPLAESYPIARYLARQFGLAGKDAWEQAKVDEFADFHKDVANEFGPYFRVAVGFQPGDKDKLHKEVFLPAVDKYFHVYEKKLKESGSGFLLPSGLTWVDFTVAEFFTTMNNMHPESVAKYPEMGKHRQRVHSHPKVKSYVEGRKQSTL